jgi:hypothetical protein
MYLGYSDPAYPNPLHVKKWNGSVWSDMGGSLSLGKAYYMQITVGVATQCGVGCNLYSYPYIAFMDDNNGRAKAFSLNGFTRLDTAQAGIVSGTPLRPFTFAIPLPESDGNYAPYFGYDDNGAGGRGRLKKYNIYSVKWDSVGPVFTASTISVEGFASDGSTHYLAIQAFPSGMVDTVKRYNGSTWSTLTTVSKTDKPALAVFNSELCAALIDGSKSNRVAVMRYSGGAWQYVGSDAVSANQANYTGYGDMGMAGLQVDNSRPYLYASYTEFDNTGSYPVVKVKAWDGSAWYDVGVSGLPTRAGIARTTFVARGGQLYIAYRSTSDNTITVLQLK